MKAFKGFNKDMTCCGFQYEEGQTYKTEQAELCETGFHACERPLDCFSYYAPGNSVYREVELEDVSSERKDDSKIVGKRIKIGAELDIAGLCKAQFQYVKEHTTFEYTDPERATAGNYGAATAGDYGAATAGDYGAATAGYSGAATAGDYGAATAGYSGAVTAGDCGAAIAGDYGAATAGYSGAATAGYSGAATAGYTGAATAGDCGAATAGNRGAAIAGDYGAATARGCSAVGKNGIACARGNGVRVMGGIGAILVIVKEEHNSYNIDCWKAFVVDGEKIKADTWYGLRDGELVELKE